MHPVSAIYERSFTCYYGWLDTRRNLMGDNPGLVGPPVAPADLAGRLVRKVSVAASPLLANRRPNTPPPKGHAHDQSQDCS